MRIVHFYAGDLKSVSEGGIATYIREIFRQSGGETTYALAGVTKNHHDKVGKWNTGTFDDVKFDLFPVLSTDQDHITYKDGIPINARYILNLFKYRSKIMGEADILHFHRAESVIPFLLFFKKRKPIVLTIHSNNYDLKISKKHALFSKRWFRCVFYEMEKFVITRVDKVIYVSLEALQSYSERCTMVKQNFIFIPTCVNADIFKPMDKEKCRAEKGLDRNNKIILFAGRLDEAKGLDLLLDTYVLLQKESDDFTLFLAGDGAERAHLENRVKMEKIKNVNFLGIIPHSDLPKLINCADVFVLTSLREGMPIVLLEALACGIPIAATNVGQVNDIVKDGVNGFIINDRNPENAKTMIIKATDLAGNGIKKCRDSVLGFSSLAMVNRINSIYEALLLKDRRVYILGVNVDNISIGGTIEKIEESIKNCRCAYIVTPNVHHLIILQRDEMFKKVYQDADLAIPDGMPLIWASKFLGMPLQERVSGSDLVPVLCKLANEKRYKIFFLGGRPGAAQKAKEVLENRYPGIPIVGTYCPPFGFENDEAENRKIIETIKTAKPDMLLVGLGAPKQEKWIHKNYKELNVPVSIGIGVTFEFISGIIKRAPQWMQRMGLEWAWRLMMEPRRLWKRYLIEDMQFFWLIIKQKFGFKIIQ